MTETNEDATNTETKNAKGKAQKKAAKPKAVAPKAKAAKAAKAARAAKPRKEKAPRESREGWGTFALRLPIPERDAFHAASGSAGASRFARIVLNAFAHDDEAAFKDAIAEARRLR